MRHTTAFKAQSRLIKELGENAAHLVWVMGLYLDDTDLLALASECLTEGSQDKKMDFVQIDTDIGRIVCVQGYYASKVKSEAPANKASDLNTAAAWFLSGDISDIPPHLREIVTEGRRAIDEGDIDTLVLLFIHNCLESVNVARELDTVTSHLQTHMSIESAINVTANELGLEQIERLYASRHSEIDVKDEVECPALVQFEQAGPNWRAGVLSIPSKWLHGLHQQYGDRLFSANYRNFLGISGHKKINAGIRHTAETRPEDFWVFNNGVTLLTSKMARDGNSTTLHGLSIINGAQTTGSIGAIDTKKHSLGDAQVLARVIECSDAETIGSIIKFNNTQNQMTTWDAYANAPEQQRIEEEFRQLGHRYERKRGGHETGESIGIYAIVQPLLAFHGNFVAANYGRNKIFNRKGLYEEAFRNRSARHILFVYTLARAVDAKRLDLKKKSLAGEAMGLEEVQLRAFRNLRFKACFIAIIGQCIEVILGRRADRSSVGFTPEAGNRSSHSVVELAAKWSPIVDTLLGMTCNQVPEELSSALSKDEAAEKIAKKVEAILYGAKSHLQFDDFCGLVARNG